MSKMTSPAPKEKKNSKARAKPSKEPKERTKRKSFLSEGGNCLLPEEPSADKKEKEDRTTMSVRSDLRLRWCNKILDLKVLAINKEFIANKMVKPEKYTTVAYDKNEAKNRYDDILCIDATRVVLKDRPAEEDYVHANWMTMPDGQKYICTQGPVTATIEDFWHMVVTEKSNVIVMLTALEDGPNSKCSRYFPTDKFEEFGVYKVSLKEKKDNAFPGIKYQILEVTGGSGSPFIVHHFIFDTWTDHTAPDSAAPTVGLHKLTKKLAAGAPITVHCSAGIGRTATFVGIDYASQKIRKEGDVYNMVEVIKDLRAQRFHSIQSAIQYLFLHMCLLELFADEGALPRSGRYEGFIANYQKLLKRFAEKNNLKKE